MELSPADPLVITATDEQFAALVSAKGGRTTTEGTAEHTLFEAMADLGWVKESTITANGIAWRLSGDGLKLANS